MALIKGNDLDMDYEDLACAVFKCNRAEDPWGYATADKASQNLYKPTELGRSIMHTLIDVAIHDNRKNDALVKSLLELKSSVDKVKENGAIKIVHSMMELLTKHGY